MSYRPAAWLWLVVLMTMAPLALANETPTQDTPDPNAVVLAHANAVPPGGGYEWKDTGVPYDVTHLGDLVIGRSKKGTYCCGVTFAVAVRAATDLGLLEDKTLDQVKQLRHDWYGTVKEGAETLCVEGLERLGIGHAVAHDDAKAGDFVQFWRTNKSGHSVIFLRWITDDNGQRVGVEYWSSQKSTDGVGKRTEYLAGAPGHSGKVDPERFYIGRLHATPGAAPNPAE